MKPSIAVIIPAYNAENYIVRCLDSIFAQTYKNLQVIVINDGSTDTTGTILQNYSREHTNISIIEQPNGGVSKARNVGIDASCADYISFIDADDTIDTDYFEKLVDAAQRNDADIVVCGCKNIDMETNKTLFTDSPLNHSVPLNNGNTIVFWGAPWGKICKSSIIKGKCYFAEGELFEDDPYSIMVHALANKVTPIDYVGYNYYINNPNSSMGIEAREHKFTKKFPFLAYEGAVKTVTELGTAENRLYLKIYYLRIFLGIIFNRIDRKNKKGILSFHYRMCKDYSLTKSIPNVGMPFKDKIKHSLMIFLTKTHLL